MKEFFDANSANTCHATLSTTTDKIQQCLSDDEKAKTKTIGTLFNLKDDIQIIKNSITNALTSGDAAIGTVNTNTISTEMRTRYNELTAQSKQLKKEIKDKQHTIDKLNRDFLDSNKNVNETKVLFLEDYTMFFVLISYLFMIFIFIFVYTNAADNKLYALAKTIGASATFTVAGGLLLYNIM